MDILENFKLENFKMHKMHKSLFKGKVKYSNMH